MPQTRKYCDGQWSDWDPALTTPPGLCVPSSSLHNTLADPIPRMPKQLLDPGCTRSYTATSTPPGVVHTRSVLPRCTPSDQPRPLLLPALFVLVPPLAPPPPARWRQSTTNIRRGGACNRWDADARVVGVDVLHRPRERHRRPAQLALRPPKALPPFGSRKYTHVSLICERGCGTDWPRLLRTKVGAISLLFRQTNIVWVAFVAAQALIDRLRLDSRQKLSSDPLLKDARPGAFCLLLHPSWQTLLLGDV